MAAIVAPLSWSWPRRTTRRSARPGRRAPRRRLAARPASRPASRQRAHPAALQLVLVAPIERLLDRRGSGSSRRMPSSPAASIRRRPGTGWTRGRGSAARCAWRRLRRADARDADQRRAVGARPARVDGRLEARHQALVRVDRGGQHGAHAARVGELAGDEVARQRRGRRVRRARRRKALAPPSTPQQALVDVHPRAVHAFERLGHEGGVQAMALRHRFERVAEGHRVVGRRQRVGILEVDLVLADGDLVVAVSTSMPMASSARTISGARRSPGLRSGRSSRRGRAGAARPCRGAGLEQEELQLGAA